MSSGQFVRAVAESELPPGVKHVFETAGKQILLCNSEGTVHAVSNICSHADEKLDCGLMRKGWIACPVHGARFDLATGKAKNPPAKRPIAVYKTRVIDGWIEVEV